MSSMEQVKNLQIPLQDILLATKGFHEENYIGRGGFGRVYRGILFHSEQYRTVAIKRLDRTSGQGEREFMMEIAMLSCYKHENLVFLVGFCDESSEKILVYEYASNGSLDKFLNSRDLTWLQRLRICLDAARGLKYLHHDAGPQHRVIHRDIKSSNILLDENWKAKISDFGLSKIGPANLEFTFLISNACGTLGYVDPQYVKTGILTKKSDVFSFGVVLFEVLCGRPASTDYNNEFLFKLAQRHYEKEALDEIVDPNLLKEMNSYSLSMFSTIAYQCVKKHREKRPTMSLVVEALEKALDAQQCTTIRFKEMRVERQDALLSEEGITRHEENKLQETLGVEEDNLISNLRHDLGEDIERHPCLPLLKRVPMFEKMDEQLLDATCGLLKPVLYTKDSYIMWEGDPIDEMIFIMQGKLLKVTTNGGQNRFLINSHYLRDGDYCGEELLTWAMDPYSSSNPPISTITVQALVEVEAFALMIDDLKFVASQLRRLHGEQLRFYSSQWRTWAATYIQVAWRRHCRKLEGSLMEEEDDDVSKTSATANSRIDFIAIAKKFYEAIEVKGSTQGTKWS